METDQHNRWKLLTDRKERWYVFINYAFFLYRGESRKTVAELAREIGVSQGLLTQWMQRNGRVPRSQESIIKLVDYFGDVIYEVLGLPIPADPIDSLPEPTRSIAREVRETLAEYKVSGDSPKSLELQEEILKKYGFEIISKES